MRRRIRFSLFVLFAISAGLLRTHLINILYSQVVGMCKHHRLEFRSGVMIAFPRLELSK